MKILFLTNDICPVYNNLFIKLIKEKCFVTVVSDIDRFTPLFWYKNLSIKQKKQFEVISVECLKKWKRSDILLFDIIIFHERRLKFIPLILHARLGGKRLILSTDMAGCLTDKHTRNFFWKFNRWVFDLIFSPEIISKTYASYYFYLNRKTPCVFIPYNSFYEITNKTNIDVVEDEVKILFIGRIVPEKGVDCLIDSIEKLSNKFFDKKIILTLVGKNFNKIDIPDRSNIHYLGSVRNTELENIIKDNHILVLPSMGDTFGIPVVEALACGVPVIVTKYTGAMLSHVTDRLNGLIIDDKYCLYGALEEYVSDFDLRKRLQLQTRSLIQTYSNEPIAERYFKFLMKK